MSLKRITALTGAAWMMAPLVCLAQPPPAGPVSAALDRDGRSVTVTAPGCAAFGSGFSAVIEVAGTKRVLSSTVGSVQPSVVSREPTPYGEAAVTTSTIHFEAEQLDLLLRFGQVPGVPGVLFQGGLRNGSAQAIRLASLTPVQATASLPVGEWAQENGRVYLDPSYAQLASQDWGKCQFNMAVAGKPLSIADKNYAHGLGTHSKSEMVFPLGGVCESFHAMVGADDGGGGSMAFEVWADGVKTFASGMLKRGEPAKAVDLSVAGIKALRLVVTDEGEGIHGAHADWADAYLTIAQRSSGAELARPCSGITLEGDPADWLITRLGGTFKEGEPGAVCALNTLNVPLEIRETGGVYRRDGVGFLFGAVGEPLAYLKADFAHAGKGRVSFHITSEMSGVRVDPGETRWGQQAILLMEKPALALARQADWVAQTHHARTNQGALSGWCSWYLRTTHITGDEVLGIAAAVSKADGRLRPAVIQIDDGYQNYDGVWEANAKFPQGMPFYAKQIAATGARPGLWMALTMISRSAPWLKDPAHMETVWNQRFKMENKGRPDENGWIDPTQPCAREHIADEVRHAVESGFTYLKTDFNNIGGGGWHEQKRTAFEIMRDHYTNVRNAAGEGAYLLCCNGEPLRATVGLVDASRDSNDAHRGGVRKAMGEFLRFYQLNGRWFAVDNDCYYLATDLKVPGIGNIGVAGGWDMIRTCASMMGLSSGAAFTSDLWQWDVFRPYWRMTEIMTPPATERTEVLDLCTAEEWPRLASTVKRPWGSWTVALLWNPAHQAQAIALDFARTGLDPTHHYAVWSFWDDKFLGIAQGRWISPVLPASACQHIVLTDLDGQPGQPVVIGSNLHIFCGAAEFKNVSYTPTGIDIELTDAGAREGDLFIHSLKPLAVGTATGCKVKAVDAVGENVWKVHLENRQSGKPQKIGLSFLNAAAVPQSVTELWADFDPRKDPLETEVIREWKSDGMVLRSVRFLVGTFKGKPARLAAFYGFPEGAQGQLPAVMHLHGGGQRASLDEVKLLVARGYAALSVNWGGREMEEARPGDVNTDWGAVDPTQNNATHYNSMLPGPKQICEDREHPKNCNWYPLTLGCRRGLTFLEQQPEVDPQRLGVHGWSMGGNLTMYVAGSDARVKAAVPGVGGQGWRWQPHQFLGGTVQQEIIKGDVEVFRRTLSFESYAPLIRCPVLHRSGMNDFHGWIDDVYRTDALIQDQPVRHAWSPHLNHGVTPEVAVGMPLWFDHFLKGGPALPETAASELLLKTADGMPTLRVTPHATWPVARCDIYYSLDPDPRDRFWRSAEVAQEGGTFAAKLPLSAPGLPLFAMANVYYTLPKPEAMAQLPQYHNTIIRELCLSTALHSVTPDELRAAAVRITDKTGPLIEDFAHGWRDWYQLSPGNRDHWQSWTHKLTDPKWRGPDGAKLALTLKLAETNRLGLVVLENQYRTYRGPRRTLVCEKEIPGAPGEQTVLLAAADFKDVGNDAPLKSWSQLDLLGLGACVQEMNPHGKFKPRPGQSVHPVLWKGPSPEITRLEWK